MKIIIGLGNPGEKYKQTRHNAGFLFLEDWAEEENLNWSQNKKFASLMAKKERIFLVKPLTYMNNSGWAVKNILSYYKLLPKKIFGYNKNSDLSEVLTVVHDDLDIPLGEYKISINSGSAGHKGVQSIIDHLKTKNFKRIRIGASSPGLKNSTEKHVLQKLKTREKEILKKTIKKIRKKEF